MISDAAAVSGASGLTASQLQNWSRRQKVGEARREYSMW
jgi:hypothetical protein